MSLTYAAEQRHADLSSYDDGQRLSAAADPFSGESTLRSSSACPSAAREKRLASASAGRPAVRPALHHFGLTTANLGTMVDWYAKVLGMAPRSRSQGDPGNESGVPAGAQAVSGWRTAWVSNDQTHHRIAIMALPGLMDDAQRSRHKGLHHIAFAYSTLDDLLGTYARLKELGIVPVLAADHGATTSFYYEDPDRNRIELMVDNFADGEPSSTFKQMTPAGATNPAGTDVDPEQMITARAAGMSVAELHERAYAGEFCSAQGFYRHCLVTAANRSAAG